MCERLSVKLCSSADSQDVPLEARGGGVKSHYLIKPRGPRHGETTPRNHAGLFSRDSTASVCNVQVFGKMWVHGPRCLIVAQNSRYVVLHTCAADE